MGQICTKIRNKEGGKYFLQHCMCHWTLVCITDESCVILNINVKITKIKPAFLFIYALRLEGAVYSVYSTGIYYTSCR